MYWDDTNAFGYIKRAIFHLTLRKGRKVKKKWNNFKTANKKGIETPKTEEIFGFCLLIRSQ